MCARRPALVAGRLLRPGESHFHILGVPGSDRLMDKTRHGRGRLLQMRFPDTTDETRAMHQVERK